MADRNRIRGFAVFSSAILAGAFFVLAPLRRAAAEGDKKKTAAELEKEKALQNPFPNDLGPDQIDDAVKGYPPDIQAGYKLLRARCAQCHSPARPLNSRFVEPDVPKAEKEAAVAKLRKEQPEAFKDLAVWQIEPDIWSRYVHRMMNKPGCGAKFGGQMTDAEAKKIYLFLVHDGQRRKLGANAKKWEEHRKKLVEQFKAKYPARYKELLESKPMDL